MIEYKTKEEIELMRESAQIVSKTLGLMASEIAEGVNLLALDKIADEFIRDHQAVPGFLGLYDYPNSIITSVNEQVVHGIPSEVAQLLKVTKQCLDLGIEQLVEGNRIGDVSFVIQQHAENHGYGVVRELVGHGLGRIMHESPEVPNFGKRGRGSKIKEGLVVAIEPMINMGTRRVMQLKDGWTIVTADKQPSAHFEHDVAVINGKPEVLSTFKFVEEELQKKNALVA
jgi:methionyl aminopeptidase